MKFYVALFLVLLGSGLPISAATYQSDIWRAEAKYGGWLQVPEASVRWVARRHGISPGEVLEELRQRSSHAPDETFLFPEIEYVIYLEQMAAQSETLPASWRDWLKKRHPRSEISAVATDYRTATRRSPQLNLEAAVRRLRVTGELFEDPYSVSGASWHPEARQYLASRLLADGDCAAAEAFATKALTPALQTAASQRLSVLGCRSAQTETLRAVASATSHKRVKALERLWHLDLSGRDQALASALRQALVWVSREPDDATFDAVLPLLRRFRSAETQAVVEYALDLPLRSEQLRRLRLLAEDGL